MQFYHGTHRRFDIGSVFWLVPGPRNFYGLGVYFTPDLKMAAGYGRHIIVVRDNGRIGFIERARHIYIVRGSLKLRVRHKKRTRLKNGMWVTFYDCTVLERRSLEFGGTIMERVVYPQPKEEPKPGMFYDKPQKNGPFGISQVDWDSEVNWPDPIKPTFIDRFLGLTLGLLLKMIAMIAKRMNAEWRHLEWLAHYLLGSGATKVLSPDEIDDLLKATDRIAPVNKKVCIARPSPSSSREWFNTLGTYRVYKDELGKGFVRLKIFDLYTFARQPGQRFDPYDLLNGGEQPLIWATSAFRAGYVIQHGVKILQRISRAMRMHVYVKRDGTILISNGLWKALGGRPFITTGIRIKTR